VAGAKRKGTWLDGAILAAFVERPATEVSRLGSGVLYNGKTIRNEAQRQAKQLGYQLVLIEHKAA